jgi:hypothetical protein
MQNTISEETRKKQRNAKLGKTRPSWVRAKIAKNMIGNRNAVKK